MGPKKGKEIDDTFWKTRIEETPLNEVNWKVKVIMIEAAGGEQDRLYLNKFEIFAAEEKRFVVKNICKTETIFMVNQLGGEKKIKDDNLRVFEEGQAYLKEKKDIPPDIQALIIKHLILKMKEDYLFIMKQKLEVREGLRRESATMLDKAEIRGTVSVKAPEPVTPVAPVKGKGKKADQETSQVSEPDEGKKYNTLLRVRGEEWRDRVYVDDFPTDGPNLYVAVTGFIEPLLPNFLIKIGIPLTAIVQIHIDPTNPSVPSSLFRPTKRGQSQTELLTGKSQNFWEELQQLRIDKNYADDFKNTAFIILTPPYQDSKTFSGEPDKIYDEICYLMYDVQDLTRQHIHYLENMDVINIPQDTEDERFKNYYSQLIHDLPLECVTIYSVLDSVLHTVCKSKHFDEVYSRSSLSTAVALHQTAGVKGENKKEQAEQFISEVFNTLCKTEENKKSYRITYGDEYETHKDPVIINYGDIAKYTTFHIGNINLNNIVKSTLFGMPINKLWLNENRPEGELEAKINFHINVLLSCFEREDVETAELNRLIHVLACRKLYNNRSSLKKQNLPHTTIAEFKKVYLKRSIFAEPLTKCSSMYKSNSLMSHSFPSMTKSENNEQTTAEEDPETHRIKMLFDCPDISELVSAAEIANNHPINHIIDDYEYFEDFSVTSAFQVMLESFNKFNCVDYKYCEVTDCIILMFYNSHDREGIAREEWRCHLPTPLCLQDFFDFVLEERYDWIQNEEKIYDERMIVQTRSEYKDVFDPYAEISCLENNDVEMELLMEGSLKYQDIMQADYVPETPEKTTHSKKTESGISSASDMKSSRKTKSIIGTSSKNLKQSYVNMYNPSDTSLGIPSKPFQGYDLGDRRVEVFGKDSMYFSQDGTQIFSTYFLIIPLNVEYVTLNVLPGNGYNQFWIHRGIGEFVTTEALEACESFRITSKDQLMINIKKQTYQIPLPTISESVEGKQKEGFTSSPGNTSLLQIMETKSFHSLYITWPNGLITESVHVNNSSEISHIKQYHIIPTPNLDEDMRCISLDGEVVIFRTSGLIEILRPDSSYIKIIKCERNIVLPGGEALSTDTNSGKSKKGKGKISDKPSKASSKATKQLPSEDEKLAVKDHEAELVIDEFETIESNGLRQKWINNIPITIEKLLIRTAVDYCIGEVFSRRMDGTNILLNKDGIQIVTFPDSSRIITNFVIESEQIYPEWTEEEIQYLEMFNSDILDENSEKSKEFGSQHIINSRSTSSIKLEEEEDERKEIHKTDGYISVQLIYTIEHSSFTTVSINKSTGLISVDSPNGSRVSISADNNFDISLGKDTSVKFDGENLHVTYESCNECKSTTTCDIMVQRIDSLVKSKSDITTDRTWLKMKDSFGTIIVVDDEGAINVMEEPYSKDLSHAKETEEVEVFEDSTKSDGKSETSVSFHDKCRKKCQAKDSRFFVLRRDLTCSELLHRELVEQYKRTCRWQPWCTINEYDTFGDYRKLLSLLMPLHVTETEKWLMESKMANKPKYLTYKDLKKDSGKGFYHWMRPYDRFEPKPMKTPNVLPPRLPRAYILRTLELQWNETHRENLKGAKELLKAILRYRNLMAMDCEMLLHIPIIDMRAEDERRSDEIIQALGHRIYENLKRRLAEDVQSRAKATITTKPPPVPEEGSVEGETDENQTEDSGDQECENILKELEEAEAISPALQRYWRRRAEELKEEEFYKYLLREGSVPPYFQNVLGGAIWWEMNHVAGEAVTFSERRKMKCACAYPPTDSWKPS